MALVGAVGGPVLSLTELQVYLPREQDQSNSTGFAGISLLVGCGSSV